MPAWEAVIVHVPVARNLAVPPAMVQTLAGEAAKLTERPELALAFKDSGMPTFWLPIAGKLIVWALRAAVTTSVTVVVSAKALELPVLATLPVTVIPWLPTGVVAAVRNVRIVLVFELAGENVAVAPVGSPAAVKATVPANPATGVIPIASVLLVPADTLTLAAAGVRRKLAAGEITKSNMVVAFAVPDVPVMVNGYVPVGAVNAGNTTKSLPVKAVLTPVGAPLTERVTAPEKPALSVTVIGSVPCSFCCRVNGLVVGFKLNGGPAATTVKLCCTDGATAYMPLPAWEAVIVQVPAERSVAVLFETVQTPMVDEVNVTGSPELAVA